MLLLHLLPLSFRNCPVYLFLLAGETGDVVASAWSQLSCFHIDFIFRVNATLLNKTRGTEVNMQHISHFHFPNHSSIHSSAHLSSIWRHLPGVGCTNLQDGAESSAHETAPGLGQEESPVPLRRLNVHLWVRNKRVFSTLKTQQVGEKNKGGKNLLRRASWIRLAKMCW